MSELPESWIRAGLDEVAEVRLGRQRSPKNHTGVRMRPYLRAANVTWSGLDLTDVKEMNFAEAESETYELQPGDVLLAEASGSASEVGKPALWRGEIANCCFQNTLLRVRSYGPLPEHLLYLLRADALAGRLGDAARGVGIHHLGAARLSSWIVPIAPLAEQRRIVAAIEEHFSRLDAADSSLHRAQHVLLRMRTAIASHATAGDWPTTRLGDVTESQIYGSSAKASGDPTGIPILRMGNIKDGRLDFCDLKYLPRDHPDVEKCRLRSGDLLFNRTNSPELVGKSAVFKSGPDGTAFASYLIRVRLTPECSPYWAALAINSPAGRTYVAAVRTQQVGQANVNGTKLAAMPIPLPPLDEQRRIVADVERQLSLVDFLAVAIKAALARSAALRRAILERAFTGRLVPQDPSDEPASVLLERIKAERAAAVSRSVPGKRR